MSSLISGGKKLHKIIAGDNCYREYCVTVEKHEDEWRVEQRWGRIGNANRTSVIPASSLADALQKADHKIAEKLKRRYVVVELIGSVLELDLVNRERPMQHLIHFFEDAERALTRKQKEVAKFVDDVKAPPKKRVLRDVRRRRINI